MQDSPSTGLAELVEALPFFERGDPERREAFDKLRQAGIESSAD